MKEKRPYFKISDLIIIMLVIIFSVTGFVLLALKRGTSSVPCKAEIRVNTRLIKTIDLKDVSEPYTLTVEGNFPVELEVSKEGVRFCDSQCPDKLCIHSGLIKSNSSAACLPAGVSVTVKGEGIPEVDGIVG